MATVVTNWVQLEARSYWFVLVISFLAAAVWESWRPKLQLTIRAEGRWLRHGIILILCSVVWEAVYRAGPVAAAIRFAGNPYGLLNRPALPYVVRFVLTFLALDLVRYAAHWAEHRVPLLWRLHQVHHSDPDFDVSTGFRAHPLELVFTQGAYLAAVAILAPPVAAVLAAELITALESSFAHANARLPAWLEKLLRGVVVTPDMHRIHHSEDAAEQMRNLGDIFSWWDRLFGTYLDRPAAGAEGIVVGLKGFQTARSADLGFMLAQPFRRGGGAAGSN
ncbi:MAG TPA: sterol desaturase family protein [Bryobacteraceae bacterium]|nr:sterol desaturase family protein [Bryobacteraceae bacterium]